MYTSIKPPKDESLLDFALQSESDPGLWDTWKGWANTSVFTIPTEDIQIMLSQAQSALEREYQTSDFLDLVIQLPPQHQRYRSPLNWRTVYLSSIAIARTYHETLKNGPNILNVLENSAALPPNADMKTIEAYYLNAIHASAQTLEHKWLLIFMIHQIYVLL